MKIKESKILMLMNTELSKKFPFMTTLLNYYYTIVITSVECERCFSLMKIIKNKLRNRLSGINLKYFLNIYLNGPDNMERFDFYDAFARWTNMKHRIFID